MAIRGGHTFWWSGACGLQATVRDVECLLVADDSGDAPAQEEDHAVFRGEAVVYVVGGADHPLLEKMVAKGTTDSCLALNPLITFGEGGTFQQSLHFVLRASSVFFAQQDRF